MQNHHTVVRTDLGESQEPGIDPVPLRETPAEAAVTDEEAFYAAQEEAFADLRARNRARPRRKL